VIASRSGERVPGIVLERVLFSDYKLVSTNGVKQVFKRGSVVDTVSFWAAGGSWNKSPTKLTVKYLALPGKTRVEFIWELNYPFELEGEEEKGYKAWVDGQLKEIKDYVQEWLDVAAEEGRLEA
jgi:hypothetical protein